MNTITVQIQVQDGDRLTITNEAITAVVNALINAKNPDAYRRVEILSDEALARLADGAQEREYRDTVQAIVDDAADQIKAGDVTDDEGLREWLEQTIDGHHDVIYTYAAQRVLLHSRNDGAYFEDFGSEGAIVDGTINWSVLAYAALLADVNEAIGDYDDFLEKHTPATADDEADSEDSPEADTKGGA